VIEQHWSEAEDLRDEYFSCLSRTDTLEQRLADVQQLLSPQSQPKWDSAAAENPVAARFVGEAEIWQCHYEESAAPMGALSRQFPTERDVAARAASVYRSLAAFVPHDTDVAVGIEENLYQTDLQNRDQLAHIGDVLADRELFARAAPYWERMATIRPGEPQAYLNPATVFWDYYNFDDALRLLDEGRSKLHNPSLYSYEAGAIYENERDYAKAVEEYVRGSLANNDSRARSRLLELAHRPRLRDAIESATAPLTSGASPQLEAVKLRVDVLDAEGRAKDVEQLLSSLAAHTTLLELLEWMEQTSQQKSFVKVQEEVLEREAEVTVDPVRRLELRYSLVRFYEQRKDLAAAQRNVEALYRETPKIMGVVRATVDFYWRNKERQRAIETLLQAANDSILNWAGSSNSRQRVNQLNRAITPRRKGC
jgi:tetratricopeptide (TPR) repeat protein